MTAGVTVDGLDVMQAGLRRAPQAVHDALLVALGKAAEATVDDARRLVPSRSGRARASLTVDRRPSGATIIGGGTRAPYFGWLEFGGNVGIKRSVERRYIKDGRYVSPTWDRRRHLTVALVEAELGDAVRRVGL